MLTGKQIIGLFLLFIDTLSAIVLPERYYNVSIPRVDNPRKSSEPFISGDSFRAICQHHLDETATPLNLNNFKRGDFVYVTPGGLSYFFQEVHPKIPNAYILVTHNSDESFPGRFEPYLSDPKLCYWATTNNTAPDHPKMISIPIGIANRYWPHGDVSVFRRVIDSDPNKRYLLTMNFLPRTNCDIRLPLFRYFKRKRFCHVPKKSSLEPYLIDMRCSYYVLSPRGNGLDCHRNWEALLLGTIPIIEKSPLSQLFEGLPVLEVDSLYNIDKQELSLQISNILSKGLQMQKAYFPYWKQLLLDRQKAVISGE